MATKIRLLDEHTINKIAAGEVIENPASVVKELVENAIDAGASSICIEIQQGGRELIRVSDNGCGMSHDDALLCLERHATSKIKEVEDIQELFTMGFRGEALPSIASISKMTLLTSESNDAGTIVKIEGGRILSTASAARSKGTTIEVKSLFFNVPVRRKFQKSPIYDAQAILKVISLMSLAYPHIQFELISDQKSLLKTVSTHSSQIFSDLFTKRIEVILGKEFAKGLLPLSAQQTPYELEGFIGQPCMHRPNRIDQYLFINQRAVQSPLISAAIREGYGTMLPNQRFPAFVLHVRLPGSMVDVNVHPQKKEVRLRQEFQLKEILMQAVQAALQRNHAPLYTQIEEHVVPPVFHLPTFTPRVHEEAWEYKPIEINIPTRSAEPIIEQAPDLPHFVPAEENPRILFTLKGYIILDPANAKLASLTSGQSGGFCVLSQKHAYARLYYERLLKQTVAKTGVQTLLLPLNLQFSTMEAQLIQMHLARLNQLGFGIREFGENAFVVDAYPDFLKNENLTDCLNLIVKDLMHMQESKRLQQIKEEQFAWVACRASYPTQRRLSIQEAQLLIEQLFDCQIPFQCPLGNAVIVHLSSEDLAKFFEN